MGSAIGLAGAAILKSCFHYIWSVALHSQSVSVPRTHFLWRMFYIKSVKFANSWSNFFWGGNSLERTWFLFLFLDFLMFDIKSWSYNFFYKFTSAYLCLAHRCNGWKVWSNGTTNMPKSIPRLVLDKVRQELVSEDNTLFVIICNQNTYCEGHSRGNPPELKVIPPFTSLQRFYYR